jgi:16S rRNA (uracil1498-N3)-methyltransferase
MKLKDALAVSGITRIVLAESEQEAMLRDVLPPRPEDVILAFGPEGGWTDAELEAFRAAGWTSASLGHTILRAETAAIAAMAIVSSL